MTRFRSIALALTAAALSVALVACNGDGDGGNDGNGNGDTTPVATEPSTTEPTASPAGDDPVSSDDPTSTPGTPAETPDVDYEQVEELAPIDDLELLVLESFPVQYRLRIVSGLPSGCAFFDRIDVARDGTTIEVSVWNLVPAPDQEIACTMIYGMVEHTVDLGTDFESGAEYTVDVNGETLTFTAQ